MFFLMMASGTTTTTRASTKIKNEKKKCCFSTSTVSWLLLPMWLCLSAAISANNAVVVDGLMPPHPDYTDYENIRDMYNRLNITRRYKTKHLLNPEHCRYLTDEQCEMEDLAYGRNRERHLQKQRERRKKRRLHNQHGRQLNPSIGTFKALVLLIRFPGDENKRLADIKYLDTIFNGKRGPDGEFVDDEINPVGSIAEYMYYASLGQYHVKFEFASRDWEMAPQSDAYYANKQSGRLGGLEMQETITWKLDELDEQGFDFSKYDADEDKELDLVVALHSGYPADAGTIKCHEHPEDRIWSQASQGAYEGGWVSSDSYILGGYVLASGLGVPGLCKQPETLFKMGTTTHEIMHCFFVPDLYDSDQDDEKVIIGGLGSFGLMSNAYGWKRNAEMPGHLSPYSRIVSGWLDPIVISGNGVYAVQPSEISGSVYQIKAGYPEGEYLLIENRGAMKWSRDMRYAGILIYHVDEKKGFFMFERGFPGHRNWPREHYTVALQQADRNYDLEKGNGFGDQGDYWAKGMSLGPNDGGDTWPNTDTYQDGIVKKTGIKITVLSDPGFIMLFQVEGMPDGDGSRSNYAPGALMPIDIGDNHEYDVENDGGGKIGRGRGPLDSGILVGGKEEGVATTGRTIAWVLSVLSSLAVAFGVLAVFYF